MILNIAGVIFAIGIVVIAHELGHFFAGKILGVKVEIFSIGFGPRVLFKMFGETEYRISLVPFGAYVKLAGENITQERPPEKWDFFGQKIWRRAVIIASGVFMNFILGWFIFSLIFFLGRPALKAVIGEVKEGEPAALVGLAAGDKILAIDNHQIEDWDQVSEIISKNPGKSLTFEIERDQKVKTLKITPRAEEELTLFNDKIEKGLIGVFPDPDQIYSRKEPLPQAIIEGTRQTLYLTKLLYVGIWKMLTLKISPKQLGGPVLIAQLAVQHIKLGFMPLMMFIGVISLNLAVVNLLPIPVFDGGHLLFLLIEKIKRRPLPLKTQEIAQTIGILIIVSLMLMVTYNDILRFFKK